MIEFMFPVIFLFLYNFLKPSYFLLCFIQMFTPIQQSTALPPLLSELELLPGVIPLCRDHGRGGLRPLNHL